MPRGLSIHIGLNHVDPNAYSGWDGALSGCINDARDMRAIADGLQYRSTLLLDAEATASRVIGEIGQAAGQLAAGDSLLLTYSGHGGQFDDVNGDEADALDETWVLWDRQLQDDELYALWSRFAAGVRIFVLSDSCHSGTMLRMVAAYRDLSEQLQRSKGMPNEGDLATLEALGRAIQIPVTVSKGAAIAVLSAPVVASENGAAPPSTSAALAPIAVFRAMPPDVRALVNAARGAELAAAQYVAGPASRAQIGASVLLISGCQDNQLSLDGTTNGLFTEKLKQVWNVGQFGGDYHAFWRGISARMPASQTPNLDRAGVTDPAFEAQRPFTIGTGGGVTPTPAPTPTPTPAASGVRPTLRRGAKGPDVVYLQQRLQLFGFNLVADGDFGPKTESAVRSFQSANSLVVDGIVGPLTWSALS